MQREADVCRSNTSVPTPSDAPPLPPSLPPESSPNWDPPPVSPCAGEEHSGENSIAMLVARPVRPSQLHRTAFSGGGRRTRSVGSCAGQQECVKDTFLKKKRNALLLCSVDRRRLFLKIHLWLVRRLVKPQQRCHTVPRLQKKKKKHGREVTGADVAVGGAAARAFCRRWDGTTRERLD